MKAKTTRWVGLIFLLIGFSINSFFLLLDQHSYINFLKSIFLPGGHILRPNILIFKIQVVFISLFIFWMIITRRSVAKSVAKSVTKSFVESSRIDKLAYLVILILFVCYNIMVLIPIFSFLKPLYAEDHFFESLTVVCALASSILLLMSINNKEGRGAKSIKSILSILFFLFGMEEISWGQRLFGWETSVALKKLNYQNETNIHNLFNPYLTIFYITFNLLLGVLLINSIKLRIKIIHLFKTQKYVHLIPYRESICYGVVFLILCFQSVFYANELTEEIFSIFGLAYSINQLLIAKAN